MNTTEKQLETDIPGLEEDMFEHKSMWHERGDGKKLVDGGLLSGGDAIMLVYGRGRSSTTYVRCAGTGRKLVDISAFHDAGMCFDCPARSGVVLSPAPTCDCPDLAAGSAPTWAQGGIAVPEGCPHGDRPIEGQPRKRGRFQFVPNGKTSVFPHSWKLLDDSDKLTLSIQYRKVFCCPEDGQRSEKSMYRHICCRLGDGRTFVSDVHTATTRIRSIGSSAPIEDITYTGMPHLFGNIEGESQPDVAEALRALSDALRSRLADRGYDIPPIARRTSRPEEALADIAALNRFPNLGYVPLSGIAETLPPWQRRKIRGVPRDTRPEQLAAALGLAVGEKASAALSSDKVKLAHAFVLSSMGAGTGAVSLIAADDGPDSCDALQALFRQPIVYRACPLDAAMLLLPRAIGPGGWDMLVRESSSVRHGDLSDAIYHALALACEGKLARPIPSLSALTSSLCVNGCLVGSPDVIDYGDDAVSYPDFSFERRAYGATWAACQRRLSPAESVVGMHRSPVPALRLELSRDGEAVADVTLTALMHLDRRSWNQAASAKFAAFLADGGASDAERLERFDRKLLSAMRFGYRVESLSFRYGIDEEAEHRGRNVIARWLAETDIDTFRIENCDKRVADALKDARRATRRRGAKKGDGSR